MKNTFGTLTFLPIKFEEASQICIQFRIDSYVASFGKADRFFEENGADGEFYLEWLKEKAKKDPWAAVHAWREKEIVGQMELGTFKNDSAIGYVNLYYLVPQSRGAGLAKLLDDYATEYFKAQSFQKARLSVSPTNPRALAFYTKMGWKDLGPRPGREQVNLMEKSF